MVLWGLHQCSDGCWFVGYVCVCVCILWPPILCVSVTFFCAQKREKMFLKRGLKIDLILEEEEDGLGWPNNWIRWGNGLPRCWQQV